MPIFKPDQIQPVGGGKVFRPEELTPVEQSFDPGDSPENPINEQHPEIGFKTRSLIMNMTTNADQGKRYLEKQGFEVQNQGGYDFSVRKPGGKWYKLDPSGLDVQDVTDTLGDFFTGTVSAIGGTLGGIAGAGAGGVVAVPGAIGGAALGAGAAAGAKGMAGRLLGLPSFSEGGTILSEAGQYAKDIGTEAVLGGATEGVFRVAAPAVSAGLKAFGKAEAALAGQTSREGALKLSQQATNITGKATAREAEIKQGLKLAGQKTSSAKAELREGYEATKIANDPALLAEKEARAKLQEAILKAREKAEGVVNAGLRRKGIDPDKVIQEGLDAMELNAKRLGEMASKERPVENLNFAAGSPQNVKSNAKNFWDVFRAEVDNNVLHPAFVYGRVLQKWPELAKIMEDVFTTPTLRLGGMEGASQRLRTFQFYRIFNEVGPDEFVRMTREYQRRAAAEMLTDRFGVVNSEARAAIERLAQGLGKPTDKEALSEMVLRVIAKLERKDPAVTAAMKTMEQARAAASKARADIFRKATENRPQNLEILKSAREAREAAQPELNQLAQDKISAMKLRNVARDIRAKSSYRRYPYWGRQTVETALGTGTAAAKLIDWMQGKGTPEAMRRLYAVAPKGIQRILDGLQKVGSKTGPTGARVAVYTALKNDGFRDWLESQI